ncbi:MAG: hypothetical protein ABW133_26190, partial [Polyangiaceae bacterium]
SAARARRLCEVGTGTALWQGREPGGPLVRHGPPAMRCRRLFSFALVMGLAACAAERERAPQATSTGGSGDPTTTGGTGTGGSTGGTSGAGGSAGVSGGSGGSSGSAGSSGSPPDASADGAPREAGPDTPLVIIHSDAPGAGSPCPSGLTTVGSNRLQAGGATALPFAMAYNAELDSSKTAGPLLIALYRVDATRPFEWMAAVGALNELPSGGVGFLAGHFDLPFTLAADRSLSIGSKPVTIALNFATSTPPVAIPIGSLALEGTLSSGCGSLSVERATLLVPIDAGTKAFHGSTVADLMGAPTETLGGIPNSAWRLDLAGTAAQVYAPGVLSDGGIEP